MSRTFKTAAALAFAVILAPAALAQTAKAPRSVTVVYGDLDISTISGGKTLLARIQAAARKVCADSDAYSPLKPPEMVCRRAKVASVVKGLGIGTLTQAFHDGQPPASQVALRD